MSVPPAEDGTTDAGRDRMAEPGGITYEVFIVHAQADLEWARRLQARLSGDGVRAALEHYLPGDIIVRRVEDLIRASAAVVFVYSRHTEADPMMAAKYAALLTGPGERRFIPALVDDVPLGPFAAARHPLNFRGEDQETPYRDLLDAIREQRPPGEPLEPYKHHRPEGAREALLRIGRDTVTFGPVDGDPVSAHVPGPLTHVLEERLWQLDRARIGRPEGTLTKSGVPAEHPGTLLDLRSREAGAALGGVFLSGPAGEAVATAVAEAAGRNSTVRLGLQVDGELTGLPWETLTLPGETRPLALHPCVDLFRHLPAGCHTPAIGILAPLRILAVAAAPDGPEGGPLLDLEAELRRVLDAVDEARRHAAAHVRILNQGTLAAVVDALKQERFHVLHISCHAAPGVLLLEDEQGGVDKVTPDRLVRAIPRDRGVPLVVLSGCSTALDIRTASAGDDATEQGEAALSGLARELSAAGVPSVLAMTAPVTDRYASLLTAAVYRELAIRPQPDVLSALSEARRTLEEDRRTAPDGSRDADLAEWATPALFLRGPSIPLYDVHRGVDTDVQPPPAVSLDPGVVVRPVGDFVGRRTELRTLRSALRDRPGVLLHGIGGVGKSTLAAELIGWLGPDAGLVVSIVGRTSPDQVLDTIAAKLLTATATAGSPAGPLRELSQFLRRLDHPWQARLDALVQTLGTVSPWLRQRIAAPPITLLLDNFEDNLDRDAGFSFLDEELAAFLAAWIRSPRGTRLLVTSRFPFVLPGGAEGRLVVWHVGPLSWSEARKLMWRLPGLDGLSGGEQERAWVVVGGHPRALEYVDALLRGGRARFADVGERLEGLVRERGVADVAGWLGVGRGLDGALAEAVTLAVDDALVGELVGLLDDLQRRVLVGVSVYRRAVDRAGLVWPVSTETPPDPDRERRLERLGELLRRARVQDPGAGVEDLGLGAGELVQAQVDAAAARVVPLVEPGGVDAAVEVLAGLGLVVPGVDEEGVGVFVVHRWTAEALARPEVTPGEVVVAAHAAAARYWRFRVQTRPQTAQQDVQDMVEARYHHHRAGDLRAAAGATDWVCERLRTWGAWSWEQQLYVETVSWFADGSREQAAGFHQLGLIAQRWGEYDRALEWYRKSLTIKEDLGNRAGMAASYHHLGRIAQERGELDQALEWYRKSLTISEDLGDRADMAATYHHLGTIAQERGDYDRALEWYRKSLTIKEDLGDRAGMAASYHHLGRIAQVRGELDQALEWYSKALTINEDLGNRAGTAASYHHLGIVDQDRGEYDQALEWYRKALTVNEDLGNRAGMAGNYHQLGRIAQERGEYDQALEWYRKALTVNEDLGNRAGMAASYHQLGVIAQVRGELDQALEWYRKALTIKEDLGNRADMAASYHQLGVIAQVRGESDQALEWYRKALTINEDLGNRAGMAATLSQIGVLCTKTGQPADAVAYNLHSLSIRAQLGTPQISIDLYWLREQRQALGKREFRRILAEQLDPASVDVVLARLDAG
ncbi:tetratricopeptide repeat protein [Sphaerisporangium sp. B11E5]|uniref:tetratricopeptide repeat protein n=1 Tax=Sphaerisporangium sp. B11E5 TaxID=3153563 RepID=UPI00325D96A8